MKKNEIKFKLDVLNAELFSLKQWFAGSDNSPFAKEFFEAQEKDLLKKIDELQSTPTK